MVHGIGNVTEKKRKTKMERDIELSKDIKDAYLQGGKAIGEIIKKRKKK